MKEGIVLFAHGSRDPQWAAPFHRIKEKLAASGAEVRLAFLESMQPPLADAIAELVAAKVERIRIVPVFLGYGGHLKRDLPDLVAAANPKVEVVIDPPVGEAPAVIEAIATLVSRR